MLDEKDYQQLEKRFDDRYDGRYVLKKDCEKTTDEIVKKLNSDYTRLAVIESHTKIIMGILAAIGAGVLTIVFEVFKG